MRLPGAQAIVSVVVPCLNEEEPIAGVVAELLAEGVDEVIVVDNGSTDATAARAHAAGARVVREPQRGYGRACQAGVAAIRPDTEIVCFIDGDGSDVPRFLPDVIGPLARREADFVMGAIGDPRLRALCEAFLSEHGERFRRTAGARSYHHARRGGLVEHTAQMMRVTMEIAPLYPELNLDLLIAGVLFHDSGKLWENYLPETGFTMGYDERGELIGHISIGLELVNSLWRKVQTEENTRAWNALAPASEDVRMHLLHLIGAHHGEPQFGSPVSPKTPEAMALNYIDNLDARMEMFAAGYLVAKPIADRIYDRVRPLPGNLVKPLEKFVPPESRPETAGPNNLKLTP